MDYTAPYLLARSERNDGRCALMVDAIAHVVGHSCAFRYRLLLFPIAQQRQRRFRVAWLVLFRSDSDRQSAAAHVSEIRIDGRLGRNSRNYRIQRSKSAKHL